MRAAEDVDNARPQLDPLGVNRHLGQQLEEIVAPRLGHPERVIAKLVGHLRGLEVELSVVVLPEGEHGDAIGH
jgi:hypothetical protein